MSVAPAPSVLRHMLATAGIIALSATACSSTTTETDGTQSSAVTVPGLFPTGVDASGALLAVKTVDPHYQLTSTAPASPVYAVTRNSLWAADTATGQWISPSTTGGTSNLAVGTYIYSTTFTISAAALSTVSVSGTWSCDNYCTVALNGVVFASLGNNTNNAYGTTGTFTVPTATAPLAGFVSGTNTLSFAVVNNGTTPSPSGLAVLTLTSSEGCFDDTNCTSAQYCNTPTSVCTAKVTNGNPIPTVVGHNPTLAGVCNPAATVGPDVCVSSVCDSDNKCGYLNGDGTCTPAASGVAVCRSGVCDTDAKCGFANGDGTCTPGNSGVAVCRSGVCDTDAKCGFGAGDGSCTPATATTVCRSATCTATGTCGCAVDSDCSSAQYCNTPTATCTAKVANGSPVPSVSGHSPALTGVCNPAATIGPDVCASGVCDTDNDCGYANSDGTCTPAKSGVAVCRSGVCDTDSKCGFKEGDGPCTPAASGSTVCRSGACSANGTCEKSGGCNVDSDCNAATQYCDTPTATCTNKVANGEPVPSVTGHTPALTGVCNPAATIGPDVCASGVCDSDNACGYEEGHGPCSDTDGGTNVCRSGACSTNGTCEKAGGCNVNADCTAPAVCNTATSTCEAPDAGAGDAGVKDAGVTDSGVADGGSSNDSGVADGGSSNDGGVTDGGARDGSAAVDDGGSLEGGGCAVAANLKVKGSRTEGAGWAALMIAALVVRSRKSRTRSST